MLKYILAKPLYVSECWLAATSNARTKPSSNCNARRTSTYLLNKTQLLDGVAGDDRLLVVCCAKDVEQVVHDQSDVMSAQFPRQHNDVLVLQTV